MNKLQSAVIVGLVVIGGLWPTLGFAQGLSETSVLTPLPWSEWTVFDRAWKTDESLLPVVLELTGEATNWYLGGAVHGTPAQTRDNFSGLAVTGIVTSGALKVELYVTWPKTATYIAEIRDAGTGTWVIPWAAFKEQIEYQPIGATIPEGVTTSKLQLIGLAAHEPSGKVDIEVLKVALVGKPAS